ncbi:MAG TPA: DUF1824 family protein [Thermosynechococcaceae cyanobacterium]
MSASPVTLATAQTLLKQFDRVDQPTEIPAESVRAALLQVVQHSDYQIFGICADGQAEAVAALHAYLKGLGYPASSPENAVTGAVYIKCNLKTGLCYAAPYAGTHRGVLVSCQSSYEGEVNEMFGHLPLDLFDRR